MRSNTKNSKNNSKRKIDTYFPVEDVKQAPELTINSVEYNLDLIGSPSLNGLGLLGDGIKIGIIDSGCVQGVFRYKNFTTEADTDLNGHGSHVTSIVLKIAPASTIYMAKAMGADGGGSLKAVVAATKWLLSEGVHIINCSFGFNSGVKVDEYVKLIDQCVDKGIIFVCASGNESASSTLFPSNMGNVFCVGAVDKNSNVTSFSNKGATMDIVAPGKDILGVGLKGMVLMSGTSQATPHVTAMLALYMNHSGIKNFFDAYNFITQNSVKDLGDKDLDKSYGYGLIQPYFAGIKPDIKPKKDSWLKRFLKSIFG